MKIVLCFGNQDVEEDSLALRFADDVEIPGYSFKRCGRIEDILNFRQDHPDEEIIILDVVKGISSPMLITDVSMLKSQKTVSLHDFDLAFFLRLLEAAGELGKVKIIGIPMEGDIKTLKDKVNALLSSE